MKIKCICRPQTYNLAGEAILFIAEAPELELATYATTAESAVEDHSV